jgi:hypothetical protein
MRKAKKPIAVDPRDGEIAILRAMATEGTAALRRVSSLPSGSLADAATIAQQSLGALGSLAANLPG